MKQLDAARILVASDSVNDATRICGQLEQDFAEVRMSTDGDKAVEDFDAFKPSVLVVAFDSLQKAQGYALGLYRYASSHHAHRSLLLCSKDEIRAAFDACRKGTFDDYVLYWPHTHDGFRLTMSVLTAARHGAATRGGGPSTLDLISHAKQLGLMQSVLEQHALEEERHAKLADGSLSHAEGAVGAAIDDLYRRLADDRTSSIVDIKDSAALSRAFDQLKRRPVSEVFKKTAKSMVPAAPWTARLKEKLAPHLSDMRAFGDKVRKIRPVILFVEDNQFARSLVQKALEGKDYEIAFAHDGTATLSLLRNMRPDLIMMDVNLPDIDGVSLTRKLKAVPHLAEIPIVMLTSEAKVQTLESSMDAGATGFVVKPFTREALLAKIDKFLSLAS